MQFPCARCGRTYEIADELCVGRAVKVACPACGALAVHRVPAPGGAPAPAPPAPPPQPRIPSPFAESDDDDFENAWSALEAPSPERARQEEPELELPELPPRAPGPAAAPPAPPPPRPAAAPPSRAVASTASAVASSPAPAAAPAPPAKGPAAPAAKAPPAKAPANAPARPAKPLEEEEPVMVTAELVIRRSARRARMTAAVAALVAIAAVGGGGFFALKMKRSTAVGEGVRRGAASAAGGGATLSEADIAKLMGRNEPEPARPAERAVPRAPAADRPKHEKLALKDRELLDLLGKKGDAAVTVQDDELAALSTTRGSLDESAIEGTLSRNSASFAACVSKAIAASPDQRLPATKVNLELTIRPSGRVAKAAVQEAAVSKLPLGQCIAQAAKRMVFPGFDGEPIDIVVPLKLKVGL